MTAKRQRTIAWWWVFPLTLAWVLGPVLLGLILPQPTGADKTVHPGFYTTARGLWWGVAVPEALSLVVPVVAITILGCWRRVLKDSVPTARWVIAVPVLLVVPCLAFADYQVYVAQGEVFVALVVVSVLLIATSEELMFRGLAVELLRTGLRERWVAVISTLLFALVHAINGGGSIPTIISAIGGGYLYYLTRRATVYLVFPILSHAAFDFFGFSHWAGESDASFYMFLYQSLVFLVVLGLYRFVPPAFARAGRDAERVSEEAGVGPTS